MSCLLFHVYANAECSSFDSKVKFADGSQACLNEFDFFTVKGVIDQDLSLTFINKIKNVSSYAIATPNNPEACPYVKQMSWDWSGSDAFQALPKCQDKLAQKIRELGLSDQAQGCKCQVLIDNGRTSLTREKFSELTSSYKLQLSNGLSPLKSTKYAIDTTSKPAKNTADDALLAEKSKLEQDLRIAKENEIKLQQEKLEFDRKVAREAEEKKLLLEKLKLEENLRLAKSNEIEAQRATLEREKQEAIRVAQLKLEENLRIAKNNEIEAQRAALEREKQEAIRAAQLKLEESVRIAKNTEIEAQRAALEREKQEAIRLAQLKIEEEKLKTLQDEQAKVLNLLRQNEELKRQQQERLLADAKREAEAKLALEESKKQQAALAKPLPTNRYALVIGNNNYKDVQKLDTAVEDAKSIALSLAQVGYKVTLKTDLKEKEMKSAFRNFKAQVSSGDEVLFYYAGHGVQFGNSNYLIPIDTAGENEEQIKDDAIPLQRILDDMTEQKVKFTLAMIDACRDNPFKKLSRNLGTRGLAPTNAATGQMIIFSAGTGQQAIDKLSPNDKDKNGLFTRIFLKEMQKPGLRVDEILRNVRNEVVKLARSVGQEQVPAIYDQVVGEFYFIN